jgi:N-carbamoyl-L-amino-acid hydrolase
MRDLDAQVLASMLAEARAASKRFASEEGCTVEWAKIWNIEPISFDKRLIEFCAESVQETAGVSHSLPSGPLHDAAEVARTGIPTVMMFTQSIAGLSHNKAEDTRIDDLKMAVQAFDRLARRTMNWLRGPENRG